MVKAPIPVLIMTYRRLDGVARLLTTLAECGTKEVYLAIDGPKSISDSEVQNTIEEWARQFADSNLISLHILRRTTNLGVGASIYLSLNWFFSKVDYGMVLEDDLEISPDFLDFAEFCREEYRNNDDVWMVSGDCFVEKIATNPSEPLYLNYPLVWGWCTWRAKWTEISVAILSEKRYTINLLRKPALAFWWSGANRALSGMVDTWDIPLAYEMLVRGKINVIPMVNLVSNRGADENAIHTKENEFPLNIPLGKLEANLISDQGEIDKKSIIRLNQLYNKHVFRIHWYHVFSPFKFFLAKFFRGHQIPLSHRIATQPSSVS